MPRVWQTPRWQRLIMQAVMWIVLGGAVGTAALTDRSLRFANIVTLGTPITEGSVTFSLPEHWKIASASVYGTALHRAIDPYDTGGRQLTVTVQPVDTFMPPVIYLERSGLLPAVAGNVLITPITLDGFPAQSARWVATGDDGQPKSEMCCCAMLPSREAVTIHLERNDTFQPFDQDLVAQVLAGVTISTPSVTHGGTVQMRGGARVDPPADFAIYPQTDPLRTDRFMVRQTAQGGWISADCVPMLMGNLPASSLRGALMQLDPMDVHDPIPLGNWLAADVSQLDKNHWRIDPHDDAAGDLLHRRAYVIAGDSGQGMLILLEAQNPAGDADLDQAYADLQDKIQTGSGATADSLLAAGASALSATAVNPPPAAAGAHWWLWSRQGIAEGTTHTYLDPTGQLPLRETIHRDWQGLIYHIGQRWGLGQTPAGIWAQTTRYDDEDQATFVTETRVTDRIMTTVRFNGQETPVMVPLSPSMVSGARLPDWLPGVAGSAAPVSIWADRFPGAESEPLPSPMLLILRPLRPSGNGRGVEVEINGTGQLSRWYFAADGGFQQADFCGDANLRPATQAEIESATQSDPRLTPPRQQPTMDSPP